jgi:hypothetical protein
VLEQYLLDGCAHSLGPLESCFITRSAHRILPKRDSGSVHKTLDISGLCRPVCDGIAGKLLIAASQGSHNIR